jgi:hypothetical protein
MFSVKSFPIPGHDDRIILLNEAGYLYELVNMPVTISSLLGESLSLLRLCGLVGRFFMNGASRRAFIGMNGSFFEFWNKTNQRRHLHFHMTFSPLLSSPLLYSCPTSPD